MLVALNMLHAAACLVIMWNCICALNNMDRRTSHVMRAAIIALTVGAFGEGTAAGFIVHVPDLAERLIVGGLAVATLANRRVNHRCPCLPLSADGAAIMRRHDREKGAA